MEFHVLSKLVTQTSHKFNVTSPDQDDENLMPVWIQRTDLTQEPIELGLSDQAPLDLDKYRIFHEHSATPDKHVQGLAGVSVFALNLGTIRKRSPQVFRQNPTVCDFLVLR